MFEILQDMDKDLSCAVGKCELKLEEILELTTLFLETSYKLKDCTYSL